MNLFGMLELSGFGAGGGAAAGGGGGKQHWPTRNHAGTPQGGPYRPAASRIFRPQRTPRFSLALGGGLQREHSSLLRVAAVVPDGRSAGDALRAGGIPESLNAEGYVAYPQVDPIEEMTDLLGAVRAYELNASGGAGNEEHDYAVARPAALTDAGLCSGRPVETE